MATTRRGFIVGAAAAVAAAGPVMTGTVQALDLDAFVRTIPFLSYETAFRVLEDARLVLPDTNRFRYLSDGD